MHCTVSRLSSLWHKPIYFPWVPLSQNHGRIQAMHFVSSPFGFAYGFFTIAFRSRLLQGPSCVVQEMVADSRQTPPFGCCGQNCMALSQLAGCFRASRSQNKPMCTLCRPELGKLGCWTSTAKPGTLNADPKKSKSLFSWHCRDAKGPGVVDEL